jgi:hypothetical protein
VILSETTSLAFKMTKPLVNWHIRIDLRKGNGRRNEYNYSGGSNTDGVEGWPD